MPSVQIDGCEIHYERLGSGSPVLLLHGLGSCGRDWERQIAPLAERYAVLSVDLRGHGASGKPPGPYSIAMLAADVVHVLEALGPGPTHVVGISMGGMVGLQLAVDAPALVSSLVVINSAPEVIPRTARERLAIGARFAALRLLGLPWLGGRIAALNFPAAEQRAERLALAARIAANDPAAYRASMKAIVGWSVADRLGSIACPVLVVSGDQDYTPVTAKERYAARIPGARVAVIARSRHVTPLDQPAELNRVLLEFLGSQPEHSRAWREPRAAGNA
jgi:pimeloyl-ACP methyl ester carboxylesterase